MISRRAVVGSLGLSLSVGAGCLSAAGPSDGGVETDRIDPDSLDVDVRDEIVVDSYRVSTPEIWVIFESVDVWDSDDEELREITPDRDRWIVVGIIVEDLTDEGRDPPESLLAPTVIDGEGDRLDHVEELDPSYGWDDQREQPDSLGNAEFSRSSETIIERVFDAPDDDLLLDVDPLIDDVALRIQEVDR